MHELSLMEGVMNAVRESAGQMNITQVSRISLVVGKLTMALPDSLTFAFNVLKESDPLLAGAELRIEEREISCCCQACGQTFTVDENAIFTCPACGSGRVDLLSGRELYIDYYEGDAV